MYQQGDVLIEEWEGKIEGNKLDHLILQEGEATGHAHRVTGEVLDWTEDDQRFIRIIGESFGELYHEDHDPEPVAIITPNVTYQVIPQQETDLSGQWQKVTD